MAKAYKALTEVEEGAGSTNLPLQHQNRRHLMQLEEGTFQTKNRQSCRVPCHEDSQEHGVQQDLQCQWA